MRAIKAIGRELFGLFVADARFTLALAAWIAIAATFPVVLQRAPGTATLLLSAGFAVVLVENLVHVAWRGQSRG